MTAYDFEVLLAKSDGAVILTHAVPKRIIGKTKVEGIEFADKTKIACDRVIKAIGQTKHFALAKSFGLAQHEDGRLKVNAETLATSQPKIFAGGDAVNGGKEVVNAAADGKRAAWGIFRELFPSQKPPADNDYWITTINGRKVAPIVPRSEE